MQYAKPRSAGRTAAAKGGDRRHRNTVRVRALLVRPRDTDTVSCRVSDLFKLEPAARCAHTAARIVVSAPGFQRYNTASVYDLLYVPRGKKQGDGYDLYVWPMNYAYSGVRSYLIAADKSVHVTTVKRRATLSDPLALPCESDVKIPCYPGR